MKSFYQFYESISKPLHYKKVYVVFYVQSFKNPLTIDKVYEDKNTADIAKKKINTSTSFTATIHTLDLGVNTPLSNGDTIYLILENYPGGYTSIYPLIYTDKTKAYDAAKILLHSPQRYAPGIKFTVEQTTFVATKHSSTKPPKSPYSNLKYPLIGELTHYLSTQGLNQEIYQTMRDKSQKSINLLNTLRTLIKKIELA